MSSMSVLRVTAAGALLFAAGVVSFAQAPAPTPANPWFQAAPLPEPSEEVLGAPVNGKLYAFSGLGPGFRPRALVYEYDPASNAWAKKKPMQLNSHHVAFAGLNNKIYAFGGFVLPEAGRAGVEPDRQRLGIRPRNGRVEGARADADQARRRGRRRRQRQDLRHRRRQFDRRRHRERHPPDASAQRADHGRGIRPRDQHLAGGAQHAGRAQPSCDRERRRQALRHRRPHRLGLHHRRQQQYRPGRDVRPGNRSVDARARRCRPAAAPWAGASTTTTSSSPAASTRTAPCSRPTGRSRPTMPRSIAGRCCPRCRIRATASPPA